MKSGKWQACIVERLGKGGLNLGMGTVTYMVNSRLNLPTEKDLNFKRFKF